MMSPIPSIGLSVWQSVQCIVENVWFDLDAIWSGRSAGFKDEANRQRDRPMGRDSFGLDMGCSIVTTQTHTHTHTHTQPFYGPFEFCLGLPGAAGTRKVKPIWIYWSKRQWVEAASAGPHANLHLDRDTTMPASHHSVFYRPDALLATHPAVSKHWRHCNQWRLETLLCSCVKVCEAIELSFGIMSGVGSGNGIRWGPHHAKRRGGFRGFSVTLVWRVFLSSFVREKCIRLVHEKFIIFPFRQYTNGNIVYWSVLRCSLLRDRNSFMRNLLNDKIEIRQVRPIYRT